MSGLTSDPQTIITVVVGACVFGLVICLWVIVMWVWSMRRASRAREVQERLGLSAAEAKDGRTLRLWHDGEEATTVVQGGKHSESIWRRMEKMHRSAGFKVPLQTILLGLVGSTSLAAVLMLAWAGSAMASLGTGAAVLMGFWVYLKKRISSQIALFDDQFLDALGLATRSLRAGHPLGGAFRLIAEEIPPPVGTTFAEICQQEVVGFGYGDAIRRAAESSSSDDMRLFAASVSIQMRSGGNLADLMERLTHVIRDRIRLNRRVQVLTAQTQMSKNALLAMPFMMFLAFNVLNAEYMSVLYETDMGINMLIMAAIGLVLGAWLMGKLSKLTY